MLTPCVVMVGSAFLAGACREGTPRDSSESDPPVLEWAAYYWTDRDDNRMLGPDIPKGSWWTDGEWFYEVKAIEDGHVRMEGYTLHEGGGLCVMEVSDSVIRTVMPEEGYTTFAVPDLRVTHQELTADSGRVQIEVLIAYDADNHPVAALQRLDDGSPITGAPFDVMEKKALDFELADIHTALCGTYSSDPDSENPAMEWTFLPDGTVRTSRDGEAMPYTVELNYHTPTHVILMPDGTHYSIKVRKGEIYLSEAIYDENEEAWFGRSDDEFQFSLCQKDCHTSPLWSHTRLVTPAMLTVMDGDLDNLANQLYSDMGENEHPVCLLNYYLLQQMSKQAGKDVEDDED